MDLATLGKIIVVWLSLVSLFNLVMLVQMSKRANSGEDGAIAAVVTAAFVFFGTAAGVVWIWRSL